MREFRRTVTRESLSPPAADGDSTSTLLERARAGDAGAADALFARCLPILQRWARGRVPQQARDVADTHEVVQDALLQTFKHLNTFDARGEGALMAYLRQAVHNRIRDHLRRVSRRPEPVALDSQHADSAPSPYAQAVSRENFERYERALDRLSATDRELIVLSIDLGYTFEQLAEATGRASADAARRAARRAIVKLAEEMRRG